MICCFIFTFLCSCVIERYRSFHIYTEGDLYNLSIIEDFENQEFLPYTIDDTIFLLLLDTGYPEVSDTDIKNDMASSTYLFQIFTKNNTEKNYEIKNITLLTSSYTKNIDELIYYFEPNYSNKTNKLWKSKKNSYFHASIIGGYFKFPRPRNDKFSIELEIKITENEIETVYSFFYNYIISYKDHWIRLLD
jgi:hypothetical protein